MIDRRTDSSPKSRIDDRGVSEVVAFVLVFGIILVSVGLLYSTGFQAMNDYQENEQLKNAERAMDALADNLNDVLRYSGVDQRYGEISMREGTVTTSGDGTELNVTIDDNRLEDEYEQFDLGEDATVELGAFRYHDGGDTVAYEGGGLVRADDSGSAVLKQPRFACSDEAAIVSLVSITGEEHSLRSSEGLGVTMSVQDRHSAVISVDDGDNVTITVSNSQYENAWDAALDSNGWDEGSCESPDRLVVTIVEAELTF